MPIDFEERVLEKLDGMDEKISNLCERMTRQEEQYKAHVNERDRKVAGDRRKFYYIMGLMTVGFTLYEVTKGLL